MSSAQNLLPVCSAQIDVKELHRLYYNCHKNQVVEQWELWALLKQSNVACRLRLEPPKLALGITNPVAFIDQSKAKRQKHRGGFFDANPHRQRLCKWELFFAFLVPNAEHACSFPSRAQEELQTRACRHASPNIVYLHVRFLAITQVPPFA